MENQTRWIPVERPDGRVIQREFEIEPQKEDSGAGFALAGLVGLVALAHNSSKNEQHKQELQQAYSQGYQQCQYEMAQSLSLAQAQVGNLVALLGQKANEALKKDAEIARLNSIVENQASALRWQQLQLTKKVFPPDDENNNSPLN